jgi:hypothetical protein
MNEIIAAVMVGLLLSLSAGIRLTVPLLAVSALAFKHIVILPHDVAWLGTERTFIILCVACAAETLVHFVPVIGTWIKAASTPLAFAAGTLLMAVPLGDRDPLLQWVLAGFLGGGMATLAHLGLTGVRAATGPANVASAGAFGAGWNILEPLVSLLFTVLGGVFLFVGTLAGLAVLIVLGGMLAVAAWRLWRRWREWTARPGQEDALP